MASFDSLPPDQKAVLSLVLQRGRGYDDIAALLAIDRAAVRDRALQAFDLLGPSTSVPAPRRALITDYLLGQLPTAVASQVHDRLASSPPDRAWARVVAAELGPVANNPLPEIPAAAGPSAPAATSKGAQPVTAAQEKAARVRKRDRDVAVAASSAKPQSRAAKDEPSGEAQAAERASSRRGGAILLALLVIVIIAVVVVLIATGGSSNSSSAAQKGTTASQTTASASTTAGTGTSATASTTPTVKKQLPLISPSGAKTPTGAADVAEEDGELGLVILASGLPANGKNAYGVWLHDSSTGKSVFLGFDPSKVSATGKEKGILEVETALPTDAASYNQLLITLETSEKPTTPGTIALEGSFSE